MRYLFITLIFLASCSKSDPTPIKVVVDPRDVSIGTYGYAYDWYQLDNNKLVKFQTGGSGALESKKDGDGIDFYEGTTLYFDGKSVEATTDGYAFVAEFVAGGYTPYLSDSKHNGFYDTKTNTFKIYTTRLVGETTMVFWYTLKK